MLLKVSYKETFYAAGCGGIPLNISTSKTEVSRPH